MMFSDSVAAPIFPSSLGHSTVTIDGNKWGVQMLLMVSVWFLGVTLMKHALEQPSSRYGEAAWDEGQVGYIYFFPLSFHD